MAGSTIQLDSLKLTYGDGSQQTAHKVEMATVCAVGTGAFGE
jgi:hypothetical protein